MSAEGIDSKRAAVRDRRYSAIFSHLLRHYKGIDPRTTFLDRCSFRYGFALCLLRFAF
jgi:hypothetical protein